MAARPAGQTRTSSTASRTLKAVTSVVASLACTAAAALIPVATAHADELRCTPVHLVVTPETGNQVRPGQHPLDAAVGNVRGANNIREVVAAYPEVSVWRNPYPASAGIFAGLIGVGGSTFLSYYESQNRGKQLLRQHLRDYHAACPGSQFVLTGFSQGAQIVGDVLAEQPIPPHTLMAAFIVSDPKRNPNNYASGFTEAAVPPVEDPAHPAAVRVNEVRRQLAAGGQATTSGAWSLPTNKGHSAAGRIGLAGSRAPGAFAAYQGRVFDFCGNRDHVCSLNPDNALIQLVRPHTENKTDDRYDASLEITGASLLTDPQLLFRLGDGRVGVAGLAQQEADLIRQARINEIQEIALFANEHASYYGQAQPATTTGGQRIDDWIGWAVDKLVSAHLGVAPRVTAVPVQAREFVEIVSGSSTP